MYQFRRVSKTPPTDRPIRAHLYATAKRIVYAYAEAAAPLLTVEADDEDERPHGRQRGLGHVWESWWRNRCEKKAMEVFLLTERSVG